ncbi:MAG: 2-C-methyl-D-erythritol 2,4-cyclodiphosphate synthase [Bacillota bacterium]|nr:2-C-methyl-D-erythritol 2,4-cyclodiphosphate synthase [Bacillota bacterium]
MMRVGIGYDVHKYTEGRDLILGGVKIPYKKGLLGHSDADVLIHAIMDSLLGAAGLRDIGYHFPDSDERYKGISSVLLLKEVKKLIEDKGFFIENIDSVIVAEKPKMSSFINSMIKNISLALGISESQINVKATTEEGLGFSGREEGIAAKAVCLLNKR